jgi:hypothetical protein
MFKYDVASRNSSAKIQCNFNVLADYKTKQ